MTHCRTEISSLHPLRFEVLTRLKTQVTLGAVYFPETKPSFVSDSSNFLQAYCEFFSKVKQLHNMPLSILGDGS